jgi:uncharacterized protein YcbX
MAGQSFVGCKPCDRCTVPTVQQNRGARRADGEPTATLQTFRAHQGKVFFGANVVNREPNGTLTVGDAVHVRTRLWTPVAGLSA